MDEFMKKTVMGKPGYIVDTNSHNIYYRIPGVSSYTLRHDGVICYMTNNACTGIIKNINDAIFTSMGEARMFLKFFGCEASDDVNYPDVFYMGGISEDNKVFADLTNYVYEEDVMLPNNIIITSEVSMHDGTTLYRPKVMKECAFNLSEIDDHRITISSFGSQVLKGIDQLPGCYFITGVLNRKLIQIRTVQSTLTSTNKVLRWNVSTLSPEHVKDITNFKFNTIDQVVFALNLYGVKDVMPFDEEFTYSHPSYGGEKTFTRHYIRYFDKDDNEIILLCRDNIISDKENVINVCEIV